MTRPHATFFSRPACRCSGRGPAPPLGPGDADQIAAHLTAIYPEELDDAETLPSRVVRAAAATAPFRISLGSAFYEGSPERGVFLYVDDPSGGVAAFRSHAGLAAGEGIDFPLHVTITHSRTSTLGMQAWSELEDARFDIDFLINAVAVTAFDGARWQPVSSHPLRG